MRVLFLTQLLPYPLDAGAKVRAYYVLRHLAAAGHTVTLCSLRRRHDRDADVAHLQSFCAAVHTVPLRRSRARDVRALLRGAVTGRSALLARDWAPAMAATIRRLVGSGPRFDLIHADQLWMAPYAGVARAESAGDGAPAVLLDQHNATVEVLDRLARIEASPVRRAVLRREARTLGAYEARICSAVDHVVWVSERDRAELERRHPELAGESRRLLAPERHPGRSTLAENRGSCHARSNCSAVVPICVSPDAQPVLMRRPGADRVTFLGGLNWPPNSSAARWFLREVWPRIRTVRPQAGLTIIGRDPPSSLVALATAQAGAAGPTGAAPGVPSVTVTGYVETPDPYLVETGVLIVPLLAASGSRVKILDAWCRGVPVVSTPIGAEGLLARDGDNVLLADSAEDFAEAVLAVLAQPALAHRLGASGRATVEGHYDWRTTYRHWDRIYEQATARRSTT